LQARVAALRDEAIEEIRDDLKALAQKLDRMAERAARELESIKAGVDFTLMETEIGLRLTVDDAKAHLKVIEAKRELVFARLAILRNQLVEAEVRVEAALRNLQEAQALAVGYHENIAALQQQAQEMLVAIRTRAETMRTSIDALLERSSRLLKEMSGLEAAAKTAA
jgi:Mg2+ and Co2+ transporter CorA